MSADVMSEADTKFIADNMLTADDFDLSESLDISVLARLSQELQLYKQSLPNHLSGANAEDVTEFFEFDGSFLPSSGSLSFEEITCNVECDRDIKVEFTSPNPSPGSTSGYSSRGSWNEDCSVTEIDLQDCDIPESPPTTPPICITTTASRFPASSSSGCMTASLSTHPLVLTPAQLTSVHQNKVPIQRIRNGSRDIQPKSMKRKLQPSSTIIGSGQPLILTAQEYSQLTASTVSIQQAPILISTPQPKHASQGEVNIKPNTAFSTFKSESVQPNGDLKALKKHQRMIRNRESASLSRKKRREYVQNLEQHIAEINQEKHLLRAENQQLKDRIKCLEAENKKLKMTFSTSNVKKTTCLMVLLFMLTLNIAPFSGLLSGNDVSLPKPPAASLNHYGRSLLWSPEDLKDGQPLPLSIQEDLAQELNAFKAPSIKNASSCSTYVNKTESLRLEKELRGWAMRVEKQKQKPPLQKLRKKLLIPMPKLHTLFNTGPQKQLRNVGHKDLEVYMSPQSVYEDLFQALERRDDTFYFVSFSGDHLLLPASAHNRTQRPKMSLVMPAMTLNETTMQDQVTMMQIDCEVMNMHLVRVKESVIPPHLRHKLGHSIPPAASSNNNTHTPQGTNRSSRHKT